MQLRDYQLDLFEQVKAASSNDIVQLDTGAGKTPIEAALAKWAPHCLLVAHRVTLISQISEKLAAFGLHHDTVSTEHTRRRCIRAHRQHGRSFIQRGNTSRLVVSIDSLWPQLESKRQNFDTSLPWLVIIDEAHHVVPGNKWGRLRELLPNARFIGFTATPARMDGESLHVDKGGLFDRLVQATSLGDDSVSKLISNGHLSGFSAYGARDPGRKIEATPLFYELGYMHLYSDPIKEYKRLASDTQAILMAPAIKNAEEFAKQFSEAGIAAAAISSAMSSVAVARVLDAFSAGAIKVVCNVDMIAEGFDMPAAQTLIIATRTASFPRYRQWVGRVLRPNPGKGSAIIIDLTGQLAAHGSPDEPVKWDLLNPPCGPKSPKCAPCGECGLYYKINMKHCPECGAKNWLMTGSDDLGSFGFDIKILDQSLLYSVRNTLSEERRVELHQQRRRTSISDPMLFGPGLIVKAASAVRAWVCKELASSGVAIESINDFVECNDVMQTSWWVKRFTAADIGKRGDKAIKEFEKWQRSR